MKNIRIEKTPECALAIEVALKAVNGRATSFTVTSAERVFGESKFFANALAQLPLRDRAGAVHTFVPDGPYANSYKYFAVSTRLTFRVGSDSKTIYLTDVESAARRHRAQSRTPVRRRGNGSPNMKNSQGTMSERRDAEIVALRASLAKSARNYRHVGRLR